MTPAFEGLSSVISSLPPRLELSDRWSAPLGCSGVPGLEKPHVTPPPLPHSKRPPPDSAAAPPPPPRPRTPTKSDTKAGHTPRHAPQIKGARPKRPSPPSLTRTAPYKPDSTPRPLKAIGRYDRLSSRHQNAADERKRPTPAALHPNHVSLQSHPPFFFRSLPSTPPPRRPPPPPPTDAQYPSKGRTRVRSRRRQECVQ